MTTITEEINCWLQKYKEWGDNDPIPDMGVFSSNSDIPCKYDFGDGQSILHIAMRRNHPTIIRHVIKVLPAQAMMDLLDKTDDNGDSAIHYAAKLNRHVLLKELLSSVRGFSTLPYLLTSESDGYTAAYIAARYNNYQMMESMLESLTDSQDEQFKLLMSRGWLGATVLHIAAFHDGVQTVKSMQKHIKGDLWYQLLKARADHSFTALHWAARYNYTEMVRILMDPLTDEQQLEVLKMRDRRGCTAQGMAAAYRYTQVPDLLKEITTTVTAIRNIKETTDQDEKMKLFERLRLNQPLSTHQIQELFPHSDRYVIPRNQQNAKQHAIILYNRHGRPGADKEANNLSGALEEAGCDVIKQTWSCVIELQMMIIDGLQPIKSSCSFLMVCLMSHGSMGCLQGADGDIAINTLLKLFTKNLPTNIPLVILIQACGGSRLGIKLQSTVHADPAVAGAIISKEDRKVDLVRPHTLLLQASSTGEPAYRGIYTGCIANQIKQANDSISVLNMEVEARIQMKKEHELGQVPKTSHTLMKHLILPGKLSQH